MERKRRVVWLLIALFFTFAITSLSACSPQKKQEDLVTVVKTASGETIEVRQPQPQRDNNDIVWYLFWYHMMFGGSNQTTNYYKYPNQAWTQTTYEQNREQYLQPETTSQTLSEYNESFFETSTEADVEATIPPPAHGYNDEINDPSPSRSNYDDDFWDPPSYDSTPDYGSSFWDDTPSYGGSDYGDSFWDSGSTGGFGGGGSDYGDSFWE